MIQLLHNCYLEANQPVIRREVCQYKLNNGSILGIVLNVRRYFKYTNAHLLEFYSAKKVAESEAYDLNCISDTDSVFYELEKNQLPVMGEEDGAYVAVRISLALDGKEVMQGEYNDKYASEIEVGNLVLELQMNEEEQFPQYLTESNGSFYPIATLPKFLDEKSFMQRKCQNQEYSEKSDGVDFINDVELLEAENGWITFDRNQIIVKLLNME